MNDSMRQVVFALATCLTIAGCCTDRTSIYHRGSTAEAPQLPGRFGARLRAGEFQLTGSVDPVLLTGVTTYSMRNPNQPAMWIPRVQVGGQAYVGVNDVFELGLQVRGASNEWTEPTLTEAVKPRLRDEITTQFGLGYRLNTSPPDHAVQVAITGEFNLVKRHSVLIVDTVCTEYSCPSMNDDLQPEFERLVVQGNSAGANVGLGVNLSWEFVEHFHLLGIFAAAFHSTNEYTETLRYNPTEQRIEDDPWNSTLVIHVGAGMEIRWHPFVFNAILHYPMSTREGLQYGPAVTASLGFSI